MSPEGERSIANAPVEATTPAATIEGPQAPEMVEGTDVSAAPGFLDVLMEQVEAETSPPATSTAGILPSVPQENVQESFPKPAQEVPQEGSPQIPHAPSGQTIPAPSPGHVIALATENDSPKTTSVDTERAAIPELKTETSPALISEPGPSPQDVQAVSDATPEHRDSATVSTAMEGVLQDPVPKIQGGSSQALTNGSTSTAGLIEPAEEVNPVKAEAPSIAIAMEGVAQDVTVLETPTEINAPASTDAEPREWETDSSPYESSDSDTSTDSDDSDDEADGEYSTLDPEELARILMQGEGGSDDEGGKGKEKGNATVRTANERQEEVIAKPEIEVTSDMQIEILGTVEATVENTVLLKAKTTGEYQVLESGSLLCLENRSVIGVIAETIGRVEQPMYTIRFTNDAAIEEAGLASRGVTVYYVVPHSTYVFTQPLKGLKGSDASNFHDEEVGDEEMEFSDDEKEAEHKRQLKLKRQGRAGRDDGGRGGRGRGRGRGRGDYRESNLRFGSVASAGNSEPIPDGSSEGALNYDDEPGEYTPLRRPGQDQPPQMLPPMTSDRGHSHGRGRGRGDRGNRGGNRGRGGRGSFDNYNRHPYQEQHQLPTPPAFNNQLQQSFQPQQTPQINGQTPFQAFSPSPISPLPSQQFNFGQFSNFPPPPPPPSATQQNYGQQQSPTGQPNGQNWTAGWQQPNFNQAAAAQVQRHLMELMRVQQQNPGQGQSPQNGYGQGQQNGYGQGPP